MRLELVTSALRGRHDTLLESSRSCKTAANKAIPFLMLFPSFQVIGSGSGTVAARRPRRDDQNFQFIRRLQEV
jgi:hypothetical protein